MRERHRTLRNMTPYRTPLHQDDPVTALRVVYLRTVTRSTLVFIGLGLLSQAHGWAPELFALSFTWYPVCSW